mmetsp:Transcript_19768/g.40703  ORF Transcript_19768/g.40703 Transcript_19768/m.40703 type:complete len:224 (-) Transcript_19768:1671-2342(-)
MDGKANRFSGLDEGIREFLKRILGLGYRQSISWNDDDLFGITQELNGFVDVGHGGFSLELDSLSSTSSLGSVASEDDAGNITVHGIAHDFGQGSSGASNESTNGSHNGHIQHESLGTKSPTRITVQNGNHNWHIGSTNRCSHVPPQNTTRCEGARQGCRTGSDTGSSRKEGSRSHGGSSESCIDRVTHLQLDRRRVQAAIEFCEGHQRSSGGDGTNDGRQVNT